MTTLTYARVARSDEVALERQQQECLALAKELGLTVDEVHSDNKTSAYSRPTRSRLAELQEGDTVIVASLDRLTRQGQVLEELMQRGVRVIAGKHIDTRTPEGTFLARIMAVTADAESERMSERIKAGIARKRA